MPIHVINFTGPINASTCAQLIEKASVAVQQDAQCLIVNIATMGGECSYGFTMYNFLLSLPIPVHTHNLGTAPHSLYSQQVSVPPLPLAPARCSRSFTHVGICHEP
jgi:ATP-dependent protease ClpP protease subunit